MNRPMRPPWRAPLLALLAAAAQALHAAPPPIETFFDEPVFSGASLSPDGTQVAFLVGAKGKRTRLGVLDLQTQQPTVVAAFDDRDVRQATWVNDKRLILDLEVELAGRGLVYSGRGLFAVNADGSGFRPLVETNRAWARRPEDGPPLLRYGTFPVDVPGRATGHHIYVSRPQEASREKVDYFLLQRLNTVTGRAEEMEVPVHSVSWAVDNSGEVRAALTSSGDRQAMHLRQADGSWKQIVEFEAIGGNGMRPRWVGPDGTLYVQAPQGDKSALWAFDPATGKTRGAPLAASKDFDLHPQFIANDKQLLGLRYTIDAEITQWMTPEMSALQAAVDKLLPATANRLSVPRHGDAPWVLVQAFADVQPTLTYVYHRGTGKLTRLGASRPGIDRRQMGQTDFVRYTARDGRSIPAYLTLPPGGGTHLPLVVLVHGGPWVRGMQWRWNAEVQFLASRGYAVLQPEFRGSAGFGFRHLEAGFKQWGRTMQDDLADGARWAIAQGHADAGRVCIAGASYGGYAVLMGLARDPELFRCGISWVGVTDILLLFDAGWSDINEESKRYGLTRMVGDPVADAAMLKTASPLENAARITQPLLMAYGEWDTRVPLVHGERFRDALKPHNTKLDYVVYPREGHGWHTPETRIDFWGRVERFLAQHIGKR